MTGASRGIGLATARVLAQEGASVALVARGSDELDAAAREVGGTAYRADTGDDAAVRSMVDAVVADLGGVDILVNSAARPGTTVPASAIDDFEDQWLRDEVEIKVLGYLRTARAVAPHMRRAGWGRIVNVSGLNARSSAHLVGSIRNVAVASLTKNLADELGPFGVNVTVVHPGMTETEGVLARIREQAKREGRAESEVVAAMARSTSIRRLVTPEEVADVIAFLCSPCSVAITGDAIPVGGGTRGVVYY